MINPKFALRTLFKTPFVTIVAIVSLALGHRRERGDLLLFDQILLAVAAGARAGAAGQPRGARSEARLASCNQAGDCDEVFSYAMFRDLQRVQTAFTGIAAHRLFGANLSYQGQTLSGEGMLVSGTYFPGAAAEPALGRLLAPEDDGAGRRIARRRPEPRVLAERGSPPIPNVLNQPLIVNGQTLTIVGVAPRGLRRHDAGREAGGVRADHDARMHGARVQGLGRPPELLGRTCSRD